MLLQRFEFPRLSDAGGIAGLAPGSGSTPPPWGGQTSSLPGDRGVAQAPRASPGNDFGGGPPTPTFTRSMCGISGLISKTDRLIEPSLIHRITDLIAHRGPDGCGYYFGPNFALGHRRLAILDLSDHGTQPMTYKEGRYWITYNGEIYNYLEIREELKRKGYRFESTTDTEVILAAFDCWGSGCCNRFNGMWAFAIYDRDAGTIFLARDRFGVKPLYYGETPDHFIFGSEIKQLLAVQRTVRANRHVVVESLLTSIDGHGSETFFDGILSFPSAHHATYDLLTHRLDIERYYELGVDRAFSALSLDDAVHQFQALFEDSVRIRLRSDVRVGTCLSGGLDSSAASAVASRLYRPHGREQFIGIHAKSIDAERDESAFARLAATHAGIALHTVKPTTADFLATVDELIDTQEEPFGSPSMFMGWHVFQRAKALGCKVMLNGQGGDEVLLGYERYFATFLRSVPLPRVVPELLALARNSKLSITELLKYGGYFTSPTLRIHRLRRRSALRPEVKANFSFELVRRSVASFASVEALQLSEIRTVQLPHLLRYEDRNSMRHSIETRLPFLDYRLVEFAISIAAKHKIHQGWSKYILRKAMEDELPAEITWRRDKLGFEAPERTWMERGLDGMRQEVAASSILADITELGRLVERFHTLPLRRRWAYFMIAAWERRQNVVW